MVFKGEFFTNASSHTHPLSPFLLSKKASVASALAFKQVFPELWLSHLILHTLLGLAILTGL